MNELIKVNFDENSERPTVLGRDLHEVLGIKTAYTVWFERMCEYGFNENTDFVTDSKNVIRPDGTVMPQKQIDHQLTIEMAKEICMIQRTDIGKQCRQYFIELEKAWNTPEMVLGRALKIAKNQLDSLKKENIMLTNKINEDRSKVLFADSVTASKNSILVGEMAKLLKQNNFDIGQNRFFEWLRTNGYLIRRKGTDYNMPTQKSMEMGLFEIKETTINHSDGHTSVSKTPKVTGKGQQYFVNVFLGTACIA